jgi:hypothetical protein
MNKKKTDADNVGSYQTTIANRQLLRFDALNIAINGSQQQVVSKLKREVFGYDF